jgi:choline dehydrogenase-like flavoprotein
MDKEANLAHRYDAVVVGSGAAGGMAAHVLTSHGLDVLLLEAGKKLDVESELRSMEWPYDHPRRGAMPYTSHALSQNEYTIRTPPYAQSVRIAPPLGSGIVAV